MSASSTLNYRLQAALTGFVSSIMLYSSGPNSDYPLLAETHAQAIAETHLTIISTLLARTYGRLLELDAHLFTSSPSPTEQLNSLLLTCRHFIQFPQDMEEEGEEEWLEDTGELILGFSEMVREGKGGNSEYRWLWGFMKVLLNGVDAASEAGGVWGIEQRGREEWFWGRVEEITGMREGPKGLKGWKEAEWFEEDLEGLWN